MHKPNVSQAIKIKASSHILYRITSVNTVFLFLIPVHLCIYFLDEFETLVVPLLHLR